MFCVDSLITGASRCGACSHLAPLARGRHASIIGASSQIPSAVARHDTLQLANLASSRAQQCRRQRLSLRHMLPFDLGLLNTSAHSAVTTATSSRLLSSRRTAAVAAASLHLIIAAPGAGNAVTRHLGHVIQWRMALPQHQQSCTRRMSIVLYILYVHDACNIACGRFNGACTWVPHFDGTIVTFSFTIVSVLRHHSDFRTRSPSNRKSFHECYSS